MGKTVLERCDRIVGLVQSSTSQSNGELSFYGSPNSHGHVLSAPNGGASSRLGSGSNNRTWQETWIPAWKIWPRAAVKSSTAELAVATLVRRGTRKYCLYVSETQDQADKHVASVAAALERQG